MRVLSLPMPSGLRAHNAGLFVSPGLGTHPNRVIDSYELIFVRSGTLGLAEEGSEFMVGAGETLLLWPGRRHHGTMPYQKDLSFYWIHFVLCPLAEKPTRFSMMKIPQKVRPARPERLTELFHHFLDDQESGESTQVEAALCVMAMLLEVRRICADATAPTDNPLAAQADQFIAAHFREGIHAGDVAAAIGVHPDYLGRIHRRAYRCTLSASIHKRQLAEARILLRETSRNMEDIAWACGFRESRYFRKLFFQQHGMSPRAYRALHARVHINTR